MKTLDKEWIRDFHMRLITRLQLRSQLAPSLKLGTYSHASPPPFACLRSMQPLIEVG